MPVTSGSDLDTAYQNAVSAFDTLQTELEDAATEEEAVPAGGTDNEYQFASQALASTEWRRISDWLEQMRSESSA
jgi:hypothetical protein